MSELPRNPIIFANPEDWAFCDMEINEPLKVDRECELALQNYDLRRYNRDLEEQNNKLKSSLIKLRQALKDSTQLISEQQRKINFQSKQTVKSESLIVSLQEKLSNADISKKCLSSGYSKQKASQVRIKNKMNEMKLQMDEYKMKW